MHHLLPAITEQVTITGPTTGALFQPQVAINANDLAMGLWFSSTAASTSSNSVVSGLAIRNADSGTTGIGIRIEPAAGGLAVSNVTVSGCWFGLNDTGGGSGAALQNDIGISINNSTSNRIGGTTAAERNVICASVGLGGVVLTNNANNNTVEGNYIGLRPDGTGTTANLAGVQIIGSTGNVIGGAGAANRNIISGNGAEGGVDVTDVAAPGANLIANNYIGLDDDGLADRGNAGDGIDVFNAVGTIIRQNIISGNNGAGIRLGQATMTSIVGNYIGLDAAGTVARPNNVGRHTGR